MFGLFGLLGSPVVFIGSILRDIDIAIILIPVFILQFTIGLLCLRMILWFIYGKETIIMSDNYLYIEKSGTFWINNVVKVNINDLKDIVLNKTLNEKYSPSKLVRKLTRHSYIFKIQNIGRIKLIYNTSKSFKFLDNVDHDKALDVIQKIKKELT